MIYRDPYASPTQSSSQGSNTRPKILTWLYLAIVVSSAHGLLNWWCVNNVSGGFWVMEGGNETPVELFAELLTLLLNVPSMVFRYVWYEFGFPPFSFTKPAVTIANSSLYGAASALVVVYFRKKKRTPQHDALRT